MKWIIEVTHGNETRPYAKGVFVDTLGNEWQGQKRKPLVFSSRENARRFARSMRKQFPDTKCVVRKSNHK